MFARVVPFAKSNIHRKVKVHTIVQDPTYKYPRLVSIAWHVLAYASGRRSRSNPCSLSTTHSRALAMFWRQDVNQRLKPGSATSFRSLPLSMSLAFRHARQQSKRIASNCANPTSQERIGHWAQSPSTGTSHLSFFAMLTLGSFVSRFHAASFRTSQLDGTSECMSFCAALYSHKHLDGLQPSRPVVSDVESCPNAL